MLTKKAIKSHQCTLKLLMLKIKKYILSVDAKLIILGESTDDMVKRVMSGDENYIQLYIKECKKARISHIKPIYLKAAYYGNKEILGLCLDRGLDINSKDHNKNTALHICAREGHIECAESLIKWKIDMKSKNSRGYTALHEAVRIGREDIINLLLKKNTSLAMELNKDNLSALHLACCKNQPRCLEAIIKKLKENKTKVKETVTHGISKEEERSAATSLLAKLLGTEDEAKQDTPMDTALSRGFKDCMEILLEINGFDPKHKNKEGKNALHNLCDKPAKFKEDWDAEEIEKGKEECLYSLFKSKRSLIVEEGLGRRYDGDGDTSLHALARNGYVGCLRILLNNIAYADMSNKDGLVGGKDGVNIGFLRTFKESGAYLKSLGFDFQIVDNCAFVNFVNERGQTALHVSCIKGYTEVVKELFSRGSDRSLTDREGNTAMQLACDSVKLKDGDVSCLDVLMEPMQEPLKKPKNDILNKKNSAGLAPIHTAVLHGNVEWVNLLIQSGCDLKVQDDDGNTPLHRAITMDHNRCVEALLKHSPGTDEYAKLQNDAKIEENGVTSSDIDKATDKILAVNPPRRIEDPRASITHTLQHAPHHSLKLMLDKCIDVVTEDLFIFHLERLKNYSYIKVLFKCTESNEKTESIQDKVLLHPISTAYVTLKKFNLYPVLLLIHVLYSLFLIVCFRFAYANHRYQFAQFANSSHQNTSSVETEIHGAQELRMIEAYWLFLFSACIVYAASEFVQGRRLGFAKYIRQVDNYFDCMLILSLAMLCPYLDIPPDVRILFCIIIYYCCGFNFVFTLDILLDQHLPGLLIKEGVKQFVYYILMYSSIFIASIFSCLLVLDPGSITRKVAESVKWMVDAPDEKESIVNAFAVIVFMIIICVVMMNILTSVAVNIMTDKHLKHIKVQYFKEKVRYLNFIDQMLTYKIFTALRGYFRYPREEQYFTAIRVSNSKDFNYVGAWFYLACCFPRFCRERCSWFKPKSRNWTLPTYYTELLGLECEWYSDLLCQDIDIPCRHIP